MFVWRVMGISSNRKSETEWFTVRVSAASKSVCHAPRISARYLTSQPVEAQVLNQLGKLVLGPVSQRRKLNNSVISDFASLSP
ncbi:hypothetical protein L2E82_47749 [Cichorium intybus]|uniref:Uncharacterized protein n=1 Tax=Cichorium intybus TaxID=13427 RepID=A0ACB8YVM2_CICIN|nr:hypothetical protein L2E82_47749 [Cichorium intybus]